MKMSRYNNDCKVYVGDLGNSASKQEIEDAFKYYGPLRNVWVARNPPGFAFVEFEDSRDADDAVRGLGNFAELPIFLIPNKISFTSINTLIYFYRWSNNLWKKS